MIKEKEKGVNRLIAFMDVLIAWVTFNIFIYFFSVIPISVWNRDLIFLNLLISGIWYILSRNLRLGELYRSRPYSVVLFNCFGLSFIGTGLIGLLIYVFKIEGVALKSLVYFAISNTIITFALKAILFSTMKMFRKRGLNYRSVVIVGDKSAVAFTRQLINRKEWGYRLIALVGSHSVFKEFNDIVPILDRNEIDLNKLIAEKTIDEVIYCREKPDMDDLENLMYSCSEVGVTFRMYSPFFNMLTSKMDLHYFDTTAVLTFTNTPQNYMALNMKRLCDFLTSSMVVLFFSPIFILISLAIKFTSKGPVFFKQKRVGLRGRKFWVYKFRTMVVNAEELKHKLMEHNEMDGPVFKMTNDPRITKVGRFLRKTSLDELPQFFNVFLGDMSIVGPRPPLPKEVTEYERWQLRRLSMKPGITCIWQISPSRNDISFEDWMYMDLEYIDNWSLKLDFVLILKTVRTMLRADGK
jgi:exopolysaccharide biosynthesis polyprenyl glycosylphosphotransferase